MKSVFSLAVAGLFVFFMSDAAVADTDASSNAEAVQRLINDTGGRARVRVDKETGQARFVVLPSRSMRASAFSNRAMRSGPRAREFFRNYGDAFGVSKPDSELMEAVTARDATGSERAVLAQTYERLPVFGGELRAHFNRDGELSAVNGNFVAGIKVNTTPTLTVEQAAGRAIRAVLVQQSKKFQASRRANDAGSVFDESLYDDLTAASSTLMVFRAGLLRGTPGADHLVYRVEVRNSTGSIREFVFVDAHTSKVVDQITGIYDALNRRAFDAEGQPHPGPNYPLVPFWLEGDALPTTSTEADNMIYASAETYGLFDTAFGRDSFDGLGATMDAIFNRGDGCPNASWNGIYISFCPGLTSDDVTGHEWAHAYTEYTNNLIYQWQSGALNESYSDIWGEVVDLINGRGTDAPAGARSDGSCSNYGAGGPGDDSYRWLMGEDAGGAIRDMWNPNCYGDPGRVSDSQYFCAATDQGGVHSNSGVPNHAFALMVDGGSYNGRTITGLGLTKAAHIEWAAQNILTPSSNFVDNADALEAACTDLTGLDLADLTTGNPSGEIITAADCAEVTEIIAAVEFRTPPSQCNFQPILEPDAPQLCENLGATQTIFYEDFESGSVPAGWTVSSYGVANPATFDTPDWDVVGGLPVGAGGLYAAFAPDLIEGDCAADNEAGAVSLESPLIVLPVMQVPHVAFDHWVATEAGWDGGNVKVSVNGGPWQLIPAGDYSFNAYNTTINGSGNPLSGQGAFSGTDGGSLTGSWGQSQINLFGLALPGDTVRLRFDLGVDECNGLVGWYVDSVRAYSCSEEPLPVCGDGTLEPGEMCDDGNSADGDGCSASCGVEDGWKCADPTAARNSTNILRDWSFEGGVPNVDWAASSTFGGIQGFPLCGPGNGCPAAGLATTGVWNIWVGGLSGGVTSSVTQEVVIPSTATELTLQALRGLCDDPSDTLDVTIDGNVIGSVTCDATDGGFVQHAFPLAGYNDGATHSVQIGGTVGGTNGTHTNFFADDIVIEDNQFVPATPSACTRVIQDVSCNVDPVGFDNGIASSWTVIDNENSGVVWTDIDTAFEGLGTGSAPGGNFTGGSGEAASVSSDAFIFTEFDTELRSNSIDLSHANSATLNYRVNYQNLAALDFLDLDISVDGGSTWTNLLSWNEDHPVGGLFTGPGEAVSIDLVDYLGQPDVQLRWRYYDPNFGDWDWYAQVDDVGLECDLSGRMTGGGFVRDDGEQYLHVFTLQCDDDSRFNVLQIHWGHGRNRNSFRLTDLNSAVCSEQPGYDAGWPDAGFNTFVGSGTGKLNGRPATIDFRFTDAGEPGRRGDEAEYTISGTDGVSVSGTLSGGNHQAHRVFRWWH